MSDMHYIASGENDKIAYLHHQGEGPGFLFLNGKHMALSDGHPVPDRLFEFLTGNDATCTFFDYGGWGKSGDDHGKFQMDRWMQNSLDILEQSTAEGESQVLVGYSMGFYIALGLAIMAPEKVSGIVGISPSITAYIKETGNQFVPKPDGEPLFPVTLVSKPEVHPIIQLPIEMDLPIRLVHGMADEMSSYHTSLNIMKMINSPNMDLQLLKTADHFYSDEADLAAVCSLFM